MSEGLDFEEFCKRHKEKLAGFGIPMTREDEKDQAKLFAALIIFAEFQIEHAKAEARAEKKTVH